jgi:hypothetical protein
MASRRCRAHPVQNRVKKVLIKTQFEAIYNPKMKKEMTTKLYNIIAQNHLRTANSRGKNVHLRRHSERRPGRTKRGQTPFSPNFLLSFFSSVIFSFARSHFRTFFLSSSKNFPLSRRLVSPSCLVEVLTKTEALATADIRLQLKTQKTLLRTIQI